MLELTTIEHFRKAANLLFFENTIGPYVQEKDRVRSFGICPLCAKVTDYRPARKPSTDVECQFCYLEFPVEDMPNPFRDVTPRYRIDEALTDDEVDEVKTYHHIEQQREYFLRRLKEFIDADNPPEVYEQAIRLSEKITAKRAVKCR